MRFPFYQATIRKPVYTGSQLASSAQSVKLNSLETIKKPALQALLLPVVFISALGGLALLAPIRQNPRTLAAFLGAAAVLCLWNVALLISKRGRLIALEVVL